ncbi:hypothetical protein VNO80_03473 [Phaseolus coccineus]|uniref:Uncharacterized protein n=1 Tax=Phaseolus coccineus TaxID=3886 RepID=A0AAN9NW48_PHACN
MESSYTDSKEATGWGNMECLCVGNWVLGWILAQLLGEKKEKRCCEWSEKEGKLIARIRGSSASAYDVKRLFN